MSAPGRWTLLLLACLGCGPSMDLGSNVLWTARFEDGTFSEWTGVPGGGANAVPSPPNTIQVSIDRAHHGSHAAQLTIDAGPDGAQENAGLNRRGGLPAQAYYSAWYYIPRTITVGTFWVIFKFRQRASADDPSSDSELIDLGLVNTPAGELTLSVVDHRKAGPFPATAPPVPVSRWFQLEAFYRNASDASGRLTVWLDGQPVFDVSQAMAPNPWVEWDVVNVGENLTPSQVVLDVDDCAVTLSRVGPTGQIAE